ncbi:ATP-binding cassette domain-containing protein [Shigella flexneri]
MPEPQSCRWVQYCSTLEGTPGETVIEAKELTKKFGDFAATDHVNFAVKRGEIFRLLGPNGAGKSTTFKMMCGLLVPTSGQALVLGIDLKEMPVKRASISAIWRKNFRSTQRTVENKYAFSLVCMAYAVGRERKNLPYERGIWPEKYRLPRDR